MRAGCARTWCSPAGNSANYTEASEQVLEICRRFTPAVEQISIDEAFLDIGGSVHLFGDAHKVGASLRQAVLAGTGLVVSVGAQRGQSSSQKWRAGWRNLTAYWWCPRSKN